MDHCMETEYPEYSRYTCETANYSKKQTSENKIGLNIKSLPVENSLQGRQS